MSPTHIPPKSSLVLFIIVIAIRIAFTCQMAPIPTGDRLMVSYELIHSSIRDLVASGALDDFRCVFLRARKIGVA